MARSWPAPAALSSLCLLAGLAPAGAGAPLLSFKGRAVIDPEKHQLRLLDAQGPEKALPAEVNPDLLRRYEFEGDVLRLSTIDASGQPTATASWKKRAR